MNIVESAIGHDDDVIAGPRVGSDMRDDLVRGPKRRRFAATCADSFRDTVRRECFLWREM